MSHSTWFCVFGCDDDEGTEDENGEIITPGGRTIVESIVRDLASRGLTPSAPAQHSFFGWSTGFSLGKARVSLLVQHISPWVLTLIVKAPFLSGRANRSASLREAQALIAESLRSDDRIHAIQWMTEEEWRSHGPIAAAKARAGLGGERASARKKLHDIGEMKQLAPGHGGCLATDRVVVDGCPVGYMYREATSRDLDSGWRFLAGDEDDAYMAEPSLHGVYDINTIVNYDPTIAPFLDMPPGSAFVREADGEFRSIEEDGRESWRPIYPHDAQPARTEEASTSLDAGPHAFVRKADELNERRARGAALDGDGLLDPERWRRECRTLGEFHVEFDTQMERWLMLRLASPETGRREALEFLASTDLEASFDPDSSRAGAYAPAMNLVKFLTARTLARLLAGNTDISELARRARGAFATLRAAPGLEGGPHWERWQACEALHRVTCGDHRDVVATFERDTPLDLGILESSHRTILKDCYVLSRLALGEGDASLAFAARSFTTLLKFNYYEWNVNDTRTAEVDLVTLTLMCHAYESIANGRLPSQDRFFSSMGPRPVVMEMQALERGSTWRSPSRGGRDANLARRGKKPPEA